MSSDTNRSPSDAELRPKPRKEPSQQRSREAFDRIVSATRSILQETGRDEFKIGQIVDQAKTPAGTIYSFFGSKQGLLEYTWPNRRDIYLASSYTPPKLKAKVRGLRNLPAGEQAQETFDRIVAAAVHVLQTTGRDGFTVLAIANEADVAIGTAYRYFDGRKGILDYLWPDRRDTYLSSETSKS